MLNSTPCLRRKPPAAHDEVERALPLAVAPVGVVQLARPVDAEADQEVVLLEEGAPGVVEQDAVGLEGLLNRLPGLAVFFDEFDGALEEFELHQRRLAALPGDRHFGRAMRLEQLADVALERRLRHPVLVVGVERLLRQEEAIGAVDVAGRPARLGEQMKARRRSRGPALGERRRLNIHEWPPSCQHSHASKRTSAKLNPFPAQRHCAFPSLLWGWGHRIASTILSGES